MSLDGEAILVERNGIRRDIEDALLQQMFFWGMDVSNPSGNQFLDQGFRRSPSKGLTGTSCYSLAWQSGSVELHGACAGWYCGEGGFHYERNSGKAFYWGSSSIPIPGCVCASSLKRFDTVADWNLFLPFLQWWLEFERLILDNNGASYRNQCYRKYKSLPKSKAWLSPSEGFLWLKALGNDYQHTPRAKRFARSLA